MKYIHKFIKYIFGSNITVVTEEKVQVEVLSRSALERLKAKLEPPILSNSDSADQAAYRLGIQRCLSMLERDFTA